MLPLSLRFRAAFMIAAALCASASCAAAIAAHKNTNTTDNTILFICKIP
jgi:hypothetical protein